MSCITAGTWRRWALVGAAWLIAAAPMLQAQTAGRRPNFVVIVADDLGMSDIGAYGGEIRTPSIDDLARRGVRYTGFYVSPTCSPTRAMLLSGMDNHLSGLGNFASYIAPNQEGKPGYEGTLSQRVAALPAILKDGGYHTYMVGKWHLGKSPDLIPRARGFERDFSLLEGGGSYYNFDGLNHSSDPSQFTEDGEYLDKLPGGYYATKTYTDKVIEYIESNKNDGKPFFAYVAHQAPHDPLQMPDSWLRRYRGFYDCGWDSVRTDRSAKMRNLGLLTGQVGTAPRLWYVPAWEDMTPAAQSTVARKMELYASMVEILDQEVGRLVSYLRESGQLDNTYIIFLSDNGPESADPVTNAKNAPGFSIDANWLARTFDIDFASWGRKNGYISYGASWAQVSAAPFFGAKGTLFEGGIRAPLIVMGPGGHGAGSVNQDARLHVTDIAPTILDLAGVEQPSRFHGRDVLPMQGVSWSRMLRGEAASPRTDNDWLGFELFGQKALIQGPWKAVSMHEPLGNENWQLFNLAEDIGEQRDLAAERPEVLRGLTALWDQYARVNNVVIPNRHPFEQMAKRLPARPAVLADDWPPGAEPDWGEEADEPLSCYERK